MEHTSQQYLQKSNRTLEFLRRNLAACPLDVKVSAYKGLSGPVLEYCSSVCILLQDELEKVQKKAARFATGNHTYETRNMTCILEQLQWKTLRAEKE